ncbi:CocE/NonD family hydrolase [Aliikangiella sp. IMCC44359]|uniref:CocE/NonD family hydrolase n=1 Tax=Aliikangiella sp. IMCC44359 TaxID=3459125 RepID=UPI00403B24F8
MPDYYLSDLKHKTYWLLTTLIIGLLLGAANGKAATQPNTTNIHQVFKKLNLPKELSPDHLQTIKNRALLIKYQKLATRLLNTQPEQLNLKQKFHLQILAQQYAEAINTIKQFRVLDKQKRANASEFSAIEFEIFAKVKLHQLNSQAHFTTAFAHIFQTDIAPLNNKQAYHATHYISQDIAREHSYLNYLHQQSLRQAEKKQLTEKTLLAMLTQYQRVSTLSQIQAISEQLINQDRKQRYHIKTDAIITTPEGIKLSAMVVRSKKQSQPQAAILTATIYSDESANLQRAIEAAAYGYVGVVSDSRGKRLSPNMITPYENEAKDVHAVIDWISQQPWNNKQVAMYGGSYLGYTQWAATKKLHPALKTIVPAVSALPFQGLPMENGIYLNANYAWNFLVTNNKYNDSSAYSRKNWYQVNKQWFESGRPYREFDQLEGKKNPWFQKWLKHPDVDQYWQSMVPFEKDYQNINIPILSLTGYYDDGQISALYYLNQHYQYNKKANHYLIIGPYDHFGAQVLPEERLRGYQLDTVAHINMTQITFDWFDHVLKDKPKPLILKNKINYQLMGDNTWRHASSLAKLNEQGKKYYLSIQNNLSIKPSFFHPENKTIYTLNLKQSSQSNSLKQIVDFKNRENHHNAGYYPHPIIQEKIDLSSGFAFVTPAFTQDMIISGQVKGELKVKINKKDFDLGLTVYELMPDGKYFHLTYYLGRASYAKDLTKRQLLTPGETETIPFINRMRMTAKKIKKGSRILVVANVNFNLFSQVNYGTGKDVSDESIADATKPLEVNWLNSSYIHLPLKPYTQ